MPRRWAVFASLVLWASGMPAAGGSAIRCPATPLEDRLPEVIAPMAGEEPIWFVGGSVPEWHGAVLEKSVWVVSREAVGDLSVSGRRLDGKGTLMFKVDETPSATFDSSDLEERWVIPGGATPEIMERYAFVPMYLIYPSPGCWEITVEVGDEERRIVVEKVAIADAE